MKSKEVPDQDGWHYIKDCDQWYYCEHPHCDELILHEPNSCVYCDRYPKRQQQRIDDGINFTGRNDPKKDTCMSEVLRPLEVIELWSGNRPIKNEG